MLGKFKLDSLADAGSQRWFLRRDSAIVPRHVFQVGIALQGGADGPYLYAYGDNAPRPDSETHPAGAVLEIGADWSLEAARDALERWLADRWGFTPADAREVAQLLLEAAWLSAHPRG